jgi:hypothetical protein
MAKNSSAMKQMSIGLETVIEHQKYKALEIKGIAF